MLQAIDSRDNRGAHEQRDMRPAQFFSGVSKRTQTFEQSRPQAPRQQDSLNF